MPSVVVAIAVVMAVSSEAAVISIVPAESVVSIAKVIIAVYAPPIVAVDTAIVIAIDISPRVARPGVVVFTRVIPRPSSDKRAVHEILRAIISVGRATIRRVAVVAIRANGGRCDI